MDINEAVKKFDSVYKSVIIPKLSPLEKYRQAELTKSKAFINILLPFKKKTIIEECKTRLKNDLFSTIVSVFGKLKSSSDIVDMDEIKEVGFCTNGNNVSYGAILSCKYKNCDIIFTEEKIQRVSSDKEDKMTFSLFNGLAIKVETNNDLKLKTILSRRAKDFSTKERKNVYLGSKVNFKFNNAEQLDTIKMEESEFGKMYDIFSNDETKTRKLLTDKLIEKIKDLRDVFNSPGISMAIINSDVYIFIEEDEFFFNNVQVDKNVADKQEFEKVFKKLIYLFNLINSFI